ncbi:ATP-dependent RNA helicase [Yamadazyma tenuis]|nr:ATP-dependent RNA helicase [Yamadazyma tenuis]
MSDLLFGQPPPPSDVSSVSGLDQYGDTSTFDTSNYEFEPLSRTATHNDFDVAMSHELPEHACAYCGLDSVDSVVKCNICNRWFCNSKAGGSSSHIVTHITLSKHKTVSLHEDSVLGDTTLECYHCNKLNVFNLGYVTAKKDQVLVILCRLPCAQVKDPNWDSDNWKPLIEEREFLPWIAAIPSEAESVNTNNVTYEQILKLEKEWRLNRDTTFHDLPEGEVETEKEEILPILMRYPDGIQYQRSFAPLVNLVSEYEKSSREANTSEHITVSWELTLSNRHLASFVPPGVDSSDVNVKVGDEAVLRYHGLQYAGWEGYGYIVGVPGARQEKYTLELVPSKGETPTDMTSGFTIEFVWRGVAFDRMQAALAKFATDEKSVSSYIYHKILGHEVKPIEFNVVLPNKLSVPTLGELNSSQLNAVRTALKRPLSLIQGPPGTGKTVTSATIIYHLKHLNKGQKVLVCAPSNVAVDHLTEKLASVGLKVLRLRARAREDIATAVEGYCLDYLLREKSKGELKKLIKLREEAGELDHKDRVRYEKLMTQESLRLLDKADIICCTCVGASDTRLRNFIFRSVLVDESTQACEPEVLIPIVKGARQVILVGDHQQLGPVIPEKDAADAGLRQSLFERFIMLGHVPLRLEVQYRMNPALSEFPSNMFYEGSLQDGVTVEDRLIKNSTFPWPVQDIPSMFWANYGKEEISGSGSSFLNRVEAMRVEKVVNRLFEDGVKGDQIGIITPYEGQQSFVTRYLATNATQTQYKDEYLSIEVASVDAFQGREKDFIILSCVRANEAQVIGFLRDPRRLNVALTRAKYGMIVLGNPRTLSRNPLWNHLLVHYRERGCLVEGLLENLQMCTVKLDFKAGANTHTSYKQDSPTPSNFSANEFNSEATSMISSNFYSRLSQLDQDYLKQKQHQSHDMNDDDIKSITSSFAAGFNL